MKTRPCVFTLRAAFGIQKGYPAFLVEPHFVEGSIQSRHLHQQKKPPKRQLFVLVETAGIEPASASPLLEVLHA